MNRSDRLLLTVDGGINLLLGVLLLAAPGWLVHALGAPEFGNRFYSSILGGVLVGIGLSLFFEVRRQHGTSSGLGLAGAILINCCGAAVVVVWLITTPVALPAHGRIALWTIAAVVLGIAVAEIATGGFRKRGMEEER